MTSETFDGGLWRLDSWGSDFAPMLFGPHDACIEIADGRISFTLPDQLHAGNVAWVPLDALDALRREHDAFARTPVRPAVSVDAERLADRLGAPATEPQEDSDE